MTVVFNDPDVTLYQGDVVQVLADLGVDFAADAIVTSPPYLDARGDVVSVTELREYLIWARDWLRALRYRCTPEANLMLNVGRIHREGVEIPLADKLRRVAQNAGWHLIDTLIWHKVNGGGGRATPYLLDRHEYVYWLSRTTAPYKGFDEARVEYSPATLQRYQRRWRAHGGVAKNVPSRDEDGREAHPDGSLPGSVFACSVGAEKGIEHPTPMALDLALHLIRLACPPGGTVLDPFSGSGTTGLAARQLGRRAVLIELDPVHCAEASVRLGQQTLLASAVACPECGAPDQGVCSCDWIEQTEGSAEPRG